jgi:alpha-mannosidase
VRHGYEYNYQLQALQVQAHSGTLPLAHSFIDVDSRNVVLTGMKKAEDANGLILRFYEWAGQSSKVEFHVPSGAKTATLTNLMEKPEGDLIPIVDSNKIGIPVGPYSITSIRINYPDVQKH